MSSFTTMVDDLPPTALESVSGQSSTLSELQREFARQYVLNGGNATKAAVLAGYSASDPCTAGRRCILNPKVLAYIKQLMVANASAYLPIAIRVLVEIACDPEADPRARVQAANSLLDRGGMSAPKGGVQVNVGVQVNGQQVQTLIGEIWDARQRRTSDIPPAMSDTIQVTARPAPLDLEALAPPQGGGGINPQGPMGSTFSIPPHVTAPSPISAERPSNSEAAAAWRAATATRATEARAEDDQFQSRGD